MAKKPLRKTTNEKVNPKAHGSVPKAIPRPSTEGKLQADLPSPVHEKAIQSPPAGLAGRLKTASQADAKQPPHLVVKALAGCGKTTTLIEGMANLRGQPTKIQPSPQQQAIWDSMLLSKDAKTIRFTCFNKGIATTLQEKLRELGLDRMGCEAGTMHSFGYSAVQRAFGRLRPPETYRVTNIISEILEIDSRELRRTQPVLLQATEKLVGLCKMNLCSGEFEELAALAAHYDIELNGARDKVFELVPKVLERCKDVARDGCIDFNDMIWLPVVLDLPVFKFDLLLIDESQDLNRCQQVLAKKAGRRLILVGDENQAIYGFAGADSESMARMEQELGGGGYNCGKDCKSPHQFVNGECKTCFLKETEYKPYCITLPLTVTRRCGKAIVEEARKIVPSFEAHESNPDGKISQMCFEGKGQPIAQGLVDYKTHVQDGDMVLCRVNAPLVSQCFRFLRAGRKATIQGRDIGAGLVSTINKMKAGSVQDLLAKLSDWLRGEESKEQAKRNPSESRLINLQDRYDCLCTFCEDSTTVQDVLFRIEKVFTDDRNGLGIRLSSVHKAKGLESRRVFILQPKGAGMPHPMARTAWQRKQEYNILYVAQTRAIEELVYVS